MFARLWIYQHERFPLVAHGLLITAFGISAMAYSAFARHAGLPAWWLLGGACVSSLLFFLQLRIADEFKDAEEDAAFRPYRPVPRGLVSLRELAWVAVAGAGVQLAIAAAISPRLVPLLLGVWIFLALMAREFFAGTWLRAHPVAYVLSHMAIMPLIDAYVSSFDWLVAGVPAPHPLGWFLALTFCNGLVIEIGRKLRAPRDEERGVETYSSLLGYPRATLAWWVSFAVTAGIATAASAIIHTSRVDAPLFAIATAAALAIAFLFLRSPLRTSANRIERFSGVWTIVMYLALGALPYALSLETEHGW